MENIESRRLVYAQWLGTIFLEGNKKKRDASAPVKNILVKNIALITSFDNVYQSINRFLPVYKVRLTDPMASAFMWKRRKAALH